MKLIGIGAGSVSVLALLATGSLALAQDGAMETVVVTGIRASMQRAIDIKRDASSVVEAVSAEDIGKFPDKNVADALQRISGVNTVSAASGEGGFDENDRVSIRGTNPSLTMTLVDGHSIANGDWFILDQYQTVGRSVSYTLLPSEIVDTAKVYKSQQADLVEGGVAGVIDIITRKPLEFKDSFTLEGSVQGVYTTLADKVSPQFNALFGWKSPDSKLGVMLQGFYEERSLRRDGQEILGYAKVGTSDATGIADPGLVGKLYPTLIGSSLFLQKRIRKGGMLTVEYSPGETFDLTVSGFYSHLGASNINNNYMFWGTQEFLNNAPTSYTVKGDTIVAANFAQKAGVNGLVADYIGRPGSGAETYYFNAESSWKPASDWTITTKVGYSRGVGKTDPQVAWEGAASVAAGYSLSSKGAAVTADADTASPATLVNDWAWTVKATAADREVYGQIDGEWALKAGPITSVKAGFRYADHHRVSDVFNGGTSYATNVLGGYGTDATSGNYPANYGNSLGVSGMLTGVPLGDISKIENILYTSPSWRPYYLTPDSNGIVRAARYDWTSSSNVGETDVAGYLMANIGGDNWKGNFGVRIVNTQEDIKQNTSGVAAVGTTCPVSSDTYSDFGCYHATPVSHTYWDILPSFNLSINATDNGVLRFAAAQTMSRPDYSALGGSVSLTDSNLTATGGNSNLKPVRAATYNTSYEWYYAPQSMLSVGLFYMDMSSYVTYGTHEGSYVNMTLTASSPTPVYSTYTITSPENTSGHAEGIEVNWQQPIWGGFGLMANYTYANGAENSGSALVGDAKHTANLTGYYENDWMSARVSYSYRSRFLVGLDRSTAENQDGYGTLNASLNFNVSDNISFTLDGLNLTNQKLRYYGDTVSQPRAIYTNGSQIYFGVRAKF